MPTQQKWANGTVCALFIKFMDLKRFFCEENINDDVVILTGDEFYHAVKVTRHKIGYKLVVCDNLGYDYYCTVTEIGKNFLVAKIDQKAENPVESTFTLNLYIGNNKDLDTVVQKAVELGVKNVIPFTSQHCNVKNINRDRLEKIVTESSKQCGRAIKAVIYDQIDFAEVVKKVKNSNSYLFYEYENDNKVSDSVIDYKKEINIIIGPEGGFSEEEIAKAKGNGIKTYTLGKRILRVGTAVVAACVLINEKADGETK